MDTYFLILDEGLLTQRTHGEYAVLEDAKATAEQLVAETPARSATIVSNLSAEAVATYTKEDSRG